MIRILHVVSSLDGGGVESLLYSYYQKMNTDKIRFDFIKHEKTQGFYEEKFKKLGSNIFYVQPKKESLKNNLRQMKEIINSNNYDIIHCHQNLMSFFPLYFAKKSNIKIRIAHSHVGFVKDNLKVQIAKKILSTLIKLNATNYCACSELAAKWLFGEKEVKKGNVKIINNAIDINKFKFSNEKRKQYRQKMEIEDKFVIGNVARFAYQKNHDFLIDIFEKIYNKNNNSFLILIGEGELKKGIEEKVKNKKLDKNVMFLGSIENVNDIIQAMDAFVLPSRYEGLGIAYIEAQVSGLYTYATKEVVPKETNVTDLIHYIDADADADFWAKEILKNADANNEEKRLQHDTKTISKKGFDINEEAKKLENYYFNLVEEAIK